MDGAFGPGAPDGRGELLLQRFRMERQTPQRPLYWRAEQQHGPLFGPARVDVGPDGALHLAPGTTLSFDTYFNAFFETPWRLHTRLGALLLRLDVAGPCEVRVFRRAPGRRDLVHHRSIAGDGPVDIRLDHAVVNFRQNGVLALELTARDGPAQFIGAAWIAEAAQARPVGLALAFCTFNREADIAAVLASVIEDDVALGRLARIYVVNQGRPGLPVAGLVARSGGKLRVIEQGNFGGAGGFGRGMLAAMDDPAVTHVALLDDDIAVEPDSLLRMAAFFALASEDLAVGGQMLDKAQPTSLFEAGAIISDRYWTFLPQHHGRDIGNPALLEELNHPTPIHFNGWWCCGFPLSLVRQVGLPLPCFIRGDDMEYGWRLHQQGVPTISFPGIAVWHEPFYLRIGSWHLYYEIRNMLVASSLHAPFLRREVVRRMSRHLVMHLLTFRYYGAALIIQGIRDYLAGPAILQQDPQAIHARLAAFKARYPVATTPRRAVLEPQRLTKMPRTAPRYLLALARAALRGATAPTRVAPARLLHVNDLNWAAMRQAEHVAVETWWDQDLPTFHRSREHFRSLGREAFWALAALYRRAPDCAAEWRAGMPGLVSVPFWRSYLGVAAPIAEQAGSEALVVAPPR